MKEPRVEAFLQQESGRAVDRVPLADRTQVQLDARSIECNRPSIPLKVHMVHADDRKRVGDLGRRRNASLRAAPPPERISGPDVGSKAPPVSDERSRAWSKRSKSDCSTATGLRRPAG